MHCHREHLVSAREWGRGRFGRWVVNNLYALWKRSAFFAHFHPQPSEEEVSCSRSFFCMSILDQFYLCLHSDALALTPPSHCQCPSHCKLEQEKAPSGGPYSTAPGHKQLQGPLPSSASSTIDLPEVLATHLKAWKQGCISINHSSQVVAKLVPWEARAPRHNSLETKAGLESIPGRASSACPGLPCLPQQSDFFLVIWSDYRYA